MSRLTFLPGCLFCIVLLLPAFVHGGAIYNCVDGNGRAVLTDKPLGNNYKCTVLERFKDPTDAEREAWEKERQAKTQPAQPGMPERPAEEGTARRQADGGVPGPEGAGRAGGTAEGAGREGAGSTGQQQLPRPQYTYPSPTGQQPSATQDALGAPSDAGGTEGASQTSPQQPWGRSRYGYYPIPMPQPQQPQSDQQQLLPDLPQQ